MKSKRSQKFRELLRALPVDIKREAYKAYRLFKRDPYHNSLQFKPLTAVKVPIFSVRIGQNYRALGRRENDDLIVWFWIGTSAEYHKYIRRL